LHNELSDFSLRYQRVFDPITAAQIRIAPALEGLDLERLPELLTEPFAEIVAARIRLRGAVDGERTRTLTQTLQRLRRLAATHESYVALLPDRDNRVAAAFVAASAHEACLLASDRREQERSHIDGATISPEVSATLLFLIAEAHADAAETAKRIRAVADARASVESALLTAIEFLAQGRIGAIASLGTPVLPESLGDQADLALQALLLMLLNGVKALALQLGERVIPREEAGQVEPASAIFLRVKALCSERLDDILPAGDPVFSLYPGPLHLANLLLAVDRNLVETAVSRISSPGGVADDGWSRITRGMAQRRPYLWRNHREAITRGYLTRGVSSAVSFPTGGGKSTLAELKIATALLRNEKVVFLAPTRALVGQTTRALQRTFQNNKILDELGEEITSSGLDDLPEVVVTTPERCLMLLSMRPEAFAEVGLIVFDECHLIHPRDTDQSRRGIDAMLALVNLTFIAPSADLLLMSAMMKNTEEIATWIEGLSGRECLSLDLAWKPTRQVRGCLVYPKQQIDDLKMKLVQGRQAHPSAKNVPESVQRQLQAQPFGFFSMRQTWSTMDREDYALLPLLAEHQQLSGASNPRRGWYLTPNGNQVSASLAAAAATSGMKTLVFVQTTIFCESSVKGFRARLGQRDVVLTDDEAKSRALVVEEMGGAAYCYLQVDDDGVFRGGAVSHHALLLNEERDLHESLFKRPNGIDVIFATSTLAQGMNLTSSVVIIAGDSRFDANVDRMQRLEAHELLNAAGRAGRAVDGAQGFVLLVPSQVIEFDDENNRINGYWTELQAIFEQSDQCLVIEDPMRHVLDQIHDGITSSGMPAYVLSRLPVKLVGDHEDQATKLLNRTLAVCSARARGDSAWADSRVASAINAIASIELPNQDKWITQLAASTGVNGLVLEQLLSLADSDKFSGTAANVVTVLLEWMGEAPSLVRFFFRPESLDGLLGKKVKNLTTDADRAAVSLPVISVLLQLWMSGSPLCDLEAAFLERDKSLGQCAHARQFVTRIVPEMAFLASLPAQLLAVRASAADTPVLITSVLANLGSMVREGCDSPESLAVRFNLGRKTSRVAARNRYEQIRKLAVPGTTTEQFDVTRERMRIAETSANVSPVN
jgi:superfamily II DNA/RNA helicase